MQMTPDAAGLWKCWHNRFQTLDLAKSCKLYSQGQMTFLEIMFSLDIHNTLTAQMYNSAAWFTMKSDFLPPM